MVFDVKWYILCQELRKETASRVMTPDQILKLKSSSSDGDVLKERLEAFNRTEDILNGHIYTIHYAS